VLVLVVVLVLGNQALPIQSLDGRHNREKDGNSQNEETSGGRSPRPTHRRARRCRTKRISARPAARQNRRNEADTQNPVQLMPPRFEHDAAVVRFGAPWRGACRDVGLAESGRARGRTLAVDLGVRLRRAQSSRSVERYAALRTAAYPCARH